MALLMGAFPSASVAELELALAGTVRAGEPARLNALAAFKALQATQASGAKLAPEVEIK
jgi:hypothetical protein